MFWFTGTHPNRKWVASIQVQYLAKQGHDSGDCVDFRVYDGYYNEAQAKAEVTYN